MERLNSRPEKVITSGSVGLSRPGWQQETRV